jgi:hypothetical protein
MGQNPRQTTSFVGRSSILPFVKKFPEVGAISTLLSSDRARKKTLKVCMVGTICFLKQTAVYDLMFELSDLDAEKNNFGDTEKAANERAESIYNFSTQKM